MFDLLAGSLRLTYSILNRTGFSEELSNSMLSDEFLNSVWLKLRPLPKSIAETAYKIRYVAPRTSKAAYAIRQVVWFVVTSLDAPFTRDFIEGENEKGEKIIQELPRSPQGYEVYLKIAREKCVELSARFSEYNLIDALNTAINDEWRLQPDPFNMTPEAPTHSLDFTSVKWHGTTYQFTKGHQSESVRLLWEAWENGTPSLSEKTIGSEVGSVSDNFRLELVFKPKNRKTGKREAHPAWGTMIKSSGKGSFALSPP